MSGIEAYVDLIPRMGMFGSQVKKEVSSATKTGGQVIVTPEMSKFAKDVSTGVKKADAKVDVPVDTDTTGFGKKLSDESGKIGKSSGSIFRKTFTGVVGGILASQLFDRALEGAKEFISSTLEGAEQVQKLTGQTAAVIKSTGGAANVSSKQVEDYAAHLSEITGVDRKTIQSGENLLLTFRNIRNETGKNNDIFNQATLITQDMAAALGGAGGHMSLKSVSIQVGKALNDPIKGITALTRVGVAFTDQQKAQIKQMVASGNTLGAQKVILQELNAEFGGSAAAQATAGEKMTATWDDFKDELGTQLLPTVEKLQEWFATKGIPMLKNMTDYLVANVIPGFVSLATWIGKHVVPVVSELFTFFSRHTGTLKAVGIGIAAIGTALVTLNTIHEVTEKYKEFDAVLEKVKGSMAEGGMLNKAAGGMKSFITSASGLSAIGLAAGPVAAALGLGAIALVHWQQKQAAIKQSTQGFDSVLDDMTKKVDLNTAALNKNVRQQAIKQLNDAGAYRAAAQLGISFNDVTQAALTGGDALKRINAATADTIGKQTQGSLSAAGYASANNKASSATTGNADAARKLSDALGTTRTGLQKSIQLHNDYTKASHEASDAADQNTGSQHSVFDAIKAATDQIKEQRAELVKQRNALINSANAALTASGDQIAWKQSMHDATQAAKDNKNTLNENTQAGRDNMSALNNLASSSLQYVQDLIKNKASQDKVTSAVKQSRQALYDTARQMGDTRDQAQKLTDKIFPLTKTNVKIPVSAPGAQYVWDQVDKLEKKIADVHGKTVEVRYNVATGSATRVGGGGTAVAQAKAGGGPIVGPGSGTSDQVPIWGSNGEYMQTAAAHKYYGTGAMDAIKNMIIPKEVLSSYAYGKYAAGGPINIAQKFPPGAYALLSKALSNAEASAVRMVTVNAQKAMAGANINYKAGAGVRQWAPDILRVLAMLGQPASLLGAVEYRMNRESGGNPRAINNWDVNAQRGDPSRGLMQTIGSTFAAYAGPFRGRSIYDPLANIYAGLNYALHAYGSISRAMYQPGGYAAGTAYALAGPAIIGENGPERVTLRGGERIDSAGKTRQILSGSSSRPITILVDLGDGLRQKVEGILDENDEFHASIGRTRG